MEKLNDGISMKRGDLNRVGERVMKSKSRLLFGGIILLLLSAFVVWELTKPMTPKNFKLDVFILCEVKTSLDTNLIDIDTVIAQLKSDSIIKASDSTTFDANRALIINSNTADESDFVAICHIKKWFKNNKEALVLYKNGEIKKVENWMRLIGGKKNLDFFDVILE